MYVNLSWFPPGLGATHPTLETDMYDLGNVADPLTLPLPPTRTEDWPTKERHVEWVLHNFTPGMLAYLYRTLREGKDYRKKSEWEIENTIAKERSPKP